MDAGRRRASGTTISNADDSAPASPVISVLSQKGGTGKTTMVRTLADVLRRVGLDVLAVDLDPQGNLSDYFDVDPDAYPTIGEVLVGPRARRRTRSTRT